MVHMELPWRTSLALPWTNWTLHLIRKQRLLPFVWYYLPWAAYICAVGAVGTRFLTAFQCNSRCWPLPIRPSMGVHCVEPTSPSNPAGTDLPEACIPGEISGVPKFSELCSMETLNDASLRQHLYYGITSFQKSDLPPGVLMFCKLLKMGLF